ncbi:50S ribosomal protein L22/unknown domain fusion protein [Clostridium homopropionicum DSM 5847]|uniref:ASCH domain-containing protein n=1 Tax=Clostridium homopropionicum DSM 5847 TaxID=1121318 RepID=A0A0L6Z5S6_9CLOT|nr:ASCH domain-containing protein [Clostridium homopropionicum]KOA18320.1 50S ribosomal protein L22/unknown domain fusion protein [Clostridium homopropionicum DSM 5847]SFF69213.1 Predicted transcriptional regulator, contains an HTH and PUA-like domains [Clostridium homopropionicum]
MKVLLSIKPEYAEKIFTGEKKYEYRRNLFKRDDIKIVVVYVTKPVGKVIGEFEIDNILRGNPNSIWEQTKLYSGIDENAYIEYFSQKDMGFAIEIKKTRIYKKPLELAELSPKIKYPPQSFMYI